jgi:hypothetical protein
MPVPPQNGVRRDHRRHLVQHVASEPVADGGQSASLVIGQSQASSTRVLL